MKTVKRPAILVRMPPKLYEDLQLMTDREIDPYAPTINAIAVRGIELALRELGKKGRGR